MTITLSDDDTKQALASIKRYFTEDLDQDIGDLKAALVLEFFLKELAPSVYNGAIGDAQVYLRERIDDLEGACSAPAFAYFGRPGVRRAPQSGARPKPTGRDRS